MSWTKVDNANEGGASGDRCVAEREVVGHNDSALLNGQRNHVLVRRSGEPLIDDRPNVAAAFLETRYDARADVLVSQDGERERLHAVILSSQVCSPLSARAAYWNAAARPSAVSCGY